MLVAAAMVVLTVVGLAGYVVDERQMLGVPLWEKPVKFAVSTLLYAVTYSWLVSRLRGRLRRVGWWAGTVAAGGLAIELVIITGLQAVGVTSHFNVATPFNVAMWSIMATSIAVVWVASLLIALALLRTPLGDASLTLAIRAGALLAIVGMALAFLMTSPNAQQLADFEGIAGAHAVGVADGGPGVPFLGWSTVAGDLRIPHFVGMHALQLIPLGAVGLGLLARVVPVLRSEGVRTRLVAIASVGYTVLLGLLTWQALRGQSIVRPDALTLTAFGALVLMVGASVVWVLARGRSGDAEQAAPVDGPPRAEPVGLSAVK